MVIKTMRMRKQVNKDDYYLLDGQDQVTKTTEQSLQQPPPLLEHPRKGVRPYFRRSLQRTLWSRWMN